MKRNLLRTIGALLLTAVLILAGANVVDYLQFTRAMARATSLTQEQLRAIGDRCLIMYKDKGADYRTSAVPIEFLPLKSAIVHLLQGSTVVALYSRADPNADHDSSLGLHFIVDTWPENQHIYIGTNVSGHEETKTLWYRDPELAKTIFPVNRLISINYDDKQWVVLPDQILVLAGRSDVDVRESILARSSITETDRSSLVEIIRGISNEARGKYYIGKNYHHRRGSVVRIRFTTDGQAREDEITANCAWIDDLGPLLRAVSKLAPKGYPIEHEKLTTETASDLKRFPVEVMNLRDFDLQYRGEPPKTPWWCRWPSWIKLKPMDRSKNF